MTKTETQKLSAELDRLIMAAGDRWQEWERGEHRITRVVTRVDRRGDVAYAMPPDMARQEAARLDDHMIILVRSDGWSLAARMDWALGAVALWLGQWEYAVVTT